MVEMVETVEMVEMVEVVVEVVPLLTELNANKVPKMNAAPPMSPSARSRQWPPMMRSAMLRRHRSLQRSAPQIYRKFVNNLPSLSALPPPWASAPPPMFVSATMDEGREDSCKQLCWTRHSTRGTWSRWPQKLPAGKHHAAGMSPSKPAPANPNKHASMSLPATATQQSQPIRHVRQCSPPRSRQCVTQSPGSPARMCASRFQSNPAEVSPRTPAHKFLTLSVLENVHLFMFPFFIFLFLQIMILQTIQHWNTDWRL